MSVYNMGIGVEMMHSGLNGVWTAIPGVSAFAYKAVFRWLARYELCRSM
jgi:hypothetical protein